jgi:hypothetical protein
MTRSLESFEPHVAELESVPVGERCELVFGARPGPQVDPGTDAVTKLEVAGDEVGMEMREEDVLDAASLTFGGGNVPVDVPLRIDDRGNAGSLVGYEVGRMRETTEVVLFKDHIAPFRGTPGAYGANTRTPRG